jgi:hypothetical protein
MELYGMQEIISWLPNLTNGHDAVSLWLSHSPLNSPFLAQNIRDPNVLGQIQSAFNYFIKSGQVWALLIGLFLGYVIRGITA